MEFGDSGTGIIDIGEEGGDDVVGGVLVSLVYGFHFADVGVEILDTMVLVRETPVMVANGRLNHIIFGVGSDHHTHQHVEFTVNIPLNQSNIPLNRSNCCVQLFFV